MKYDFCWKGLILSQ